MTGCARTGATSAATTTWLSSGTQDITIDVPIDQLPEPDNVRMQAQFLQLWGIDELVDEGKRIWETEAARPGLVAMKMRSRISEAEALLDPAGLGDFLVAEWRARTVAS